MIRRYMIMSAAVAALALSSCGGGDNSDGSPSPTPSPTPTPTASPTYAAFPLGAATQFNTIDATTSYTGDPATGAVTLGVASTEMLSNRVNLATDSAIATGTYVIDEIGNTSTEESRFVNANVKTAPAPAVPEFMFRIDDTATAGKFTQLEFLNNTIPSQVTSDASLALTQVSYANWWRGDSTAGAKRLTYAVWGYPTVPSDMPTSGTANYAVRVVGRVVSVSGTTSSILRVGGTATTSVDFASGLVTTTLNLTKIDATGAETPYTTLTAQSGIKVGQYQFTGSFTGGSALSGTLSGAFFGSQGANIGIAFAASGTIAGTDQRLVGEVVGKKQ